jgi:hypothetical protein
MDWGRTQVVIVAVCPARGLATASLFNMLHALNRNKVAILTHEWKWLCKCSDMGRHENCIALSKYYYSTIITIVLG